MEKDFITEYGENVAESCLNNYSLILEDEQFCKVENMY